MFDLFKRYGLPPTKEYTIKKYPRMDVVKKMMMSELKRVKNYYRIRERGVANDHLLSRLITMCSLNITLSDMGYRGLIKSDYMFKARQLNIVSDISVGDYHSNLFYANNATDILYIVENEYDWFTLKDNWKDCNPIRCVYHTLTDMDMYSMYGDKQLEEPSLFVYEIDIVLLMMMYKYWSEERLTISDTMSVNPTRFLAMYVFPNIVGSVLDLSIINRLFAYSENSDVKSFVNSHPFHVMDYSKDIDRILNNIVYLTKGEEIYLEQLFLTVPVIENDTMYDVMMLHKNYYTRQSEWVMWVSRIGYVYKLLIYLDKKGMIRNRDELYYLPAMIRRLENRSTATRLPSHRVNELTAITYKIKDILGKR